MTDTISTPDLQPDLIQPAASILPGWNVMLMGAAGTGKTHSLGTLVDTGIEVFYIGLEPGLESLLGYWRDRNLPVPSNLHWHNIEPPSADFTDFMSTVEKIGKTSFEGISKMVDPNKSRYNTFYKLLTALNSFEDQATGQNFGSVMEWGPDRCVAIDSLTGINTAAMSTVIGGKPVKNQADWAVAQDLVEKVITMLCNNCKCHFVLIAHIQREVDQIGGGIKLLVDTLGKALLPKLPRLFSDVILATRDGAKWYWDTASTNADVKTRNLPLSERNAPSFAAIMKSWNRRRETES